ncbi:MAG TPA: capsule assembly Wzi family protein [Candidatus Saccharimonadales bacterium]|nr:capsule assembly Wzi family protein [Candidatus Saccharimonadales bacterium]
MKLGILVVFFCLVASCWSQTDGGGAPASTPPAPSRPGRSDADAASLAPTRLLRNLAVDQKDIWTSPFHARIRDLNWLAPAIGLSAGLINADQELSSRLSTTGSGFRHAGTVSNGGVAALVAGGGGLYLLGKIQGDDHKQETGILAGEAALNAFVVDEVFKVASRRERPIDGAGQGRFGKGGSLNSGFPSNHAMVAWSIASLLAHEYPGMLTKVLAYGTATAISVTRVTGKNHFPSDVVVGSSMGWLIGRQIFNRHHQADSDDALYGTFVKDREPREEGGGEFLFSPYVPLDSWVYPAFERLSALGVVPSGMLGLRPWTRQECARLLEEMPEFIDDTPEDDSPNDEATRLRGALVREFNVEMNGGEGPYAAVDSVYARVTGISGQPLTDGYHFGSTIVNDFGRPFQKGLNAVTGFSSSASAGALGFVVRGEFEHAPSAPGFSQAVQDALLVTDQRFISTPASPVQAFNRLRLLDSYVTLNVKGWQASFGKQSLWLGPTRDPFLASNNAEPLYMFRVDQTSPRKLPGFMGFLGPYRFEFWVGKLTGEHVVVTQDATGFVARFGRSLERQPMLNGQKLNFRPTPNLEFGVGKTGLWGGPNFPITAGSTRRSLVSTGNGVGPGTDPGDRRSTFDFSYRIPGFRKWLMLYNDSFVEDEVSPIGYPRRAAHNPGLYMPQLPWLHHADFRVEASYTNLPNLIEPPGGGFFYWNTRYVDGYTNKGNILGNGTVGRQGIAFRGETRWWFDSDKTITAGYRTSVSDPSFAQGGAFRDVFLRSEWSFKESLSVSSLVQYEWWNFPLLTAGKQRNDFTASVQLTYKPRWRIGNGK